MGCGLGSCLLTTDENGVATTSVTPLRAGTLLLTAQFGQLSQNVSFTAIAPNETLTAMNPVIDLAEGSVREINLTVIASEDGVAGADQEILWTSSGALQLATTSTVTNSAGGSTVMASLGPLGAGKTASATACVWSTICASFTVHGISAKTHRPGVVLLRRLDPR
jgi:hypothetical protein